MHTSNGARPLSGLSCVILAGMLAVALTGCTATRTTQEKPQAGAITGSTAKRAMSAVLAATIAQSNSIMSWKAVRQARLWRNRHNWKAYTQYQNAEYEEAVATLDRFIRLNPASPGLDYAYYLKGVVNLAVRQAGFRF